MKVILVNSVIYKNIRVKRFCHEWTLIKDREINTNKDKSFWSQRKEESITEESDIKVKRFYHE